MGLLISCFLSTIGTMQLVSARIADYAKSRTEAQILTYALDSKLSREEVLFRDAEGRICKRKDLIELVGTSSVLSSTCDLYIDQINKRSQKANDGYFRKFIFQFTDVEIEDGGSKKNGDIGNHSIPVRQHSPSGFHLPLPKVTINDANKCDLWCIPISYQNHALAIVINIKEACFEYLDSGSPDKEAAFATMNDLPHSIVNFVTIYINCTRQRRGGDMIDFSEFKWAFPPVPCQPSSSLACTIYMLRFLEEWSGGRSLCRFEGWDDDSWHVKERRKICASILIDQDSNVILDEVKERAREWQTTKRGRSEAEEELSTPLFYFFLPRLCSVFQGLPFLIFRLFRSFPYPRRTN